MTTYNKTNEYIKKTTHPIPTSRTTRPPHSLVERGQSLDLRVSVGQRPLQLRVLPHPLRQTALHRLGVLRTRGRGQVSGCRVRSLIMERVSCHVTYKAHQSQVSETSKAYDRSKAGGAKMGDIWW